MSESCSNYMPMCAGGGCRDTNIGVKQMDRVTSKAQIQGQTDHCREPWKGDFLPSLSTHWLGLGLCVGKEGRCRDFGESWQLESTK